MSGAREKALRFLREVPRLSINNVKVRSEIFSPASKFKMLPFQGLPQIVGIDPQWKRKRGRGNKGHDQGE